MSTDDQSVSPPSEAPRWQALGAIDRRVLGVLAEKAKTTPDTYPMSLNAVVTGCNQKSNRDPMMNLQPDDVEQSLDRLRGMGAVGLVEGHGRVQKYRHYLYQWLGVDKVELAVMTELFLRGPQTEGELRARVARMEPIADLPALRGVLAGLKAKGLVLDMTPEGRGHVVSHALYPAEELKAVRARYGRDAVAPVQSSTAAGQMETNEQFPYPPTTAASAPGSVPAPSGAAGFTPELVAGIRRELDEIREQLKQLRSDVDGLLGTRGEG